MKNILKNKWKLLLGIILFGTTTGYSQIPEITVIYPRSGQIVTAVDSTFILGHLPENLPCKPKEAVLRINGSPVEVHRDGGFIAFLPVSPGLFTFKIDAYLKKEIEKAEKSHFPEAIASTALDVYIPEPLRSLPYDTLQIAGDYRPPSGNLTLITGDMLSVAFQGTPGMSGWFSIEGVVDSVPVSEAAPGQQPYWGEHVFGAGAVPDSLLITGLYTGYYIVPPDVSAADVKINYHLTPDKKRLLDSLLAMVFPMKILEVHKRISLCDKITAQSGYTVSLNPPDYPFTVLFTDSVQILRHGPRRGYFSCFQPAGVQALVVAREGDWYRARLSQTQYTWINKNAVKVLPRGIMPPESSLKAVRTYNFKDHLLIECPLSGLHPFRIIEDDRRSLRIQFFGVTSDTDWIRYDFSDSLIDIMTWLQPEKNLYEIRLELLRDIWGYDTYYEGNTFYFQLNKAPQDTRRLKGKTIVIDPGHSQDPGAVGPTGYTEDRANLEIALVLKDMLKASGVKVVMTREDDRHLPLYERPIIAKKNKADLFISIHNNALPDGVNPFINNGVSTYYYHPHSMALARCIQAELLKTTGQADYGLYHGNLAVNRPTQYPAVLVECTFIILPEQEARLKTYKFRKQIATAIIKGIENFLEGYDHER